MCQFLIKFVLASGILFWLVWFLFHFEDLIPFLVQESATCVRSSLPQDSAVASGTEKVNIKCYIREFQTPPFYTGTYNGTTQETSGGSAGKNN